MPGVKVTANTLLEADSWVVVTWPVSTSIKDSLTNVALCPRLSNTAPENVFGTCGATVILNVWVVVNVKPASCSGSSVDGSGATTTE